MVEPKLQPTLADELERLQAWHQKLGYQSECEAALWDKLPTILDALEAISAENARLKAALRPFAEAAEDLDEDTPDRCDMWEHHVSMNVEAGDFRRAAAALKEPSDA